MRLIAPDGSEIIGTLERVPGVAQASSFDEDGTPNYEGGTELYWDDQRTVMRNGSMVYVTEDGMEFTLDQLTVAPDEGDEEDEE